MFPVKTEISSLDTKLPISIPLLKKRKETRKDKEWKQPKGYKKKKKRKKSFDSIILIIRSYYWNQDLLLCLKPWTGPPSLQVVVYSFLNMLSFNKQYIISFILFILSFITFITTLLHPSDIINHIFKKKDIWWSYRYNTLTTKQKKKIHLATAEYYRLVYKDPIPVSAILQHYFLAWMDKEGLNYCIKAAKHP